MLNILAVVNPELTNLKEDEYSVIWQVKEINFK